MDAGPGPGGCGGSGSDSVDAERLPDQPEAPAEETARTENWKDVPAVSPETVTLRPFTEPVCTCEVPCSSFQS